MSLVLTWDILSGQFGKRMAELEAPIAEAATRTMDRVLAEVKVDARASIARAGFSTRWQNALRLERFPKGGKKSVNAAVFIFHRIVYAGVFEEGATIPGSPLLWIPLPHTPKKIGRNRMTPRNYASLVGPLVSLKSPSGTPLLGATVRLSKNKAAQSQPKITLAELKRGKSGLSTADRLKGRNPRGKVQRTIPLFSGIKMANIRKRFNISEICEMARNRIPEIYARMFEGND